MLFLIKDRGRLLGLAWALLAALAWTMGIHPSPAAAQTCVPNSTAAPVPGTAVTCSGTIVDGDGANGFGDGTQDGLVITVTSGSSVAGTNLGFELNADNVVDNSGSISAAIGAGIFANDMLDVFNRGIIVGPFAGVVSNGDLFVTNARSGVISGDTGVGGHNVTLVNHGTIAGMVGGVIATGFAGIANIINTGTISADPMFGLGVAGPQVHLSNSGTISGDTGVFAFGGGSTLVNSGWIIGTTSSIEFSGGGDTLTLLPGSRLVGSVELGQFNAPSTVNVQTGSDIGWLITFGACGCGGLVENQSVVNLFGGAPAVVAGNRIATLDPTAFGLSDRNVMDFTGWISSLLTGRFGEMGAGSIGASSFAPEQSPVVAAANDAFASVTPAQAYAADRDAGLLPNATVVSRDSGIAVWTKAFAGAASYGGDEPMLPASSAGYGGAFGIDRQINSVLRAGAFVGGGFGKLDVDRDSQSIDSDYLFGGLYGRFDWTSHFLDVAVTIGRSSNDSDRLVANNMVAGGLETATASYDGWFVSPELAYGIRIPVNANMIVTPTARVRYLGGRFDGYSESDSAQALSVGERELSDIEERLELAFTLYEPASAGLFKTTATVGALAFQRLGDDAIDAVLIGQNLSFATPGDDSSVGAYAGLGFDYRLSAAANLYASIEGRVMSNDTQSAVAHAGVRLRF